MMLFSLSEQTAYFLWSIVLGVLMAMIYDVIRAVRMLTRCGKIHTMISDILFFFVCGILTSLFALPFNKGDVRAFILFGEAAGFLTYRLTLGSVFGRFYAVFARLLRWIIQKICEKLKKIYDCLLKAGAFLLYNMVDKIERILRTAFSGLRILFAGACSAHRKRRRPPSKNRGARHTDDRQREPVTYYPIPLRGDSIDTSTAEFKRNQHEQKSSKRKEKHQKNKRNQPEH